MIEISFEDIKSGWNKPMFATVGYDVEVIGKNCKLSNELKTKLKSKKEGKKDNIAKDGPLIEFKNPNYKQCRENLIASFKNNLKEVESIVNVDKNAVSIWIPQKKFDKLSEEDKELGCEPDENVYEHKCNIPKNTLQRTCGFHMHIGHSESKENGVLKNATICAELYDEELKEHLNIKIEKNIQSSIWDDKVSQDKKEYKDYLLGCHLINEDEFVVIENLKEVKKIKVTLDKKSPDRYTTSLKNPDFIKLLDLFVGIPGILFSDALGLSPQESERRNMYGKAGTYRKKPYGIEYRVLSNFPINQPTYVHMLFGFSRIAHELVDKPIVNKMKKINLFELVRTAINTQNVKIAAKIYKEIIYPIFEIINDCWCDVDQKGRAICTAMTMPYDKSTLGKELKIHLRKDQHGLYSNSQIISVNNSIENKTMEEFNEYFFPKKENTNVGTNNKSKTKRKLRAKRTSCESDKRKSKNISSKNKEDWVNMNTPVHVYYNQT